MIDWSYLAQAKGTPSTWEYTSIIVGVSPKVRQAASVVSA